MNEKDLLELLMKRIISGYMKEQSFEENEFVKEDDRSFVFLEKGTLNLILPYLLSGENRKTAKEGNEEFELKLLAELDQTIENNKNEFEEIMELLKGFK